MGQKKIKTIDLSESLEKKVKKATEKKVVSKEKLPETKETEKVEKKTAVKTDDKKEEKEKAAEEKQTKTTKPRKVRVRSKRYKTLKLKVDRSKYYKPEEALELLLSIANSKIDETVEIHINAREKLTGSVKLPHGTGKTQKIAIVNDTLLAQIEKGKINFDILIATPKDMPKIAKVAKILGPKGLMPNPKAGTISENPKEAKKKFEGGELRFKTEPKAPLLHVSIGKVSFGKEKLLENFKSLVKAVEPRNILKTTLSSTHSPGIKLNIS